MGVLVNYFVRFIILWSLLQVTRQVTSRPVFVFINFRETQNISELQEDKPQH